MGAIDLMLTGGHVVDPAAGLDGVADVAIADGRILAVGRDLALPARQVRNVSGQLVVPGLIDTHGHVYQHVTGRFGLEPDMVGVRSGVTTVVDQGGPSLMTLPGFRHFIAEPAATRVLCYLSAYMVGGLEGHYYPSLYGPEQVDVPGTIKAGLANRDLVKGIKAHAEIGGASRWGLDVIRLACEIARGIGVPLYIHLGQLWPTKDHHVPDPDKLVAELVPLMAPGDVLAHPFTRHPGGFISTATGEVHPVVWAALERGVRVDVGHGSHFSFAMARKTLAAGIRPFTLGADLHGYNVKVPSSDADRTANPFFGVAAFSLTHAMSELLHLGMTLSEVVATVTSNAADLLGLSDEIGTLATGRVADVSVLDVNRGRFRLSDNSGETVIADTLLTPAFCLRGGVGFAADSPLIPRAPSLAA